uniref:RNA-binding region-containing protein 3 n=1 Tax=Ciona savignyi TaxID=51511 RepID=H2YH96_CIOSA
ILIKHLPAELTPHEKRELLRCFGAEDVRVMSRNGQLRDAAFATFPNHQQAKTAVNRLHQLEVLGCVLSAEFARKAHQNQAVDAVEDINAEESKEMQEKDDSKTLKRCKHCQRLPPIAPHFGVEYFTNPKLKYKYPEPDADILLNICGAMLTLPKFYTQVLHLMNKMNLFPPFSPAIVPPILQEKSDFGEGDVRDMSESESEIESEKEDPQTLSTSPKRKLTMLKNIITDQDTSDPMSFVKSVVSPHVPEQEVARKTISLNMPSNFNTIVEDTIFSDAVDDVNQETNLVFDFITLKQLGEGRIGEKELSENPLFKNYRPGEPSCRLYVKNLSKKVTEKDMKFIFGSFVDFSSETDRNMFDVRVMTHGRMKGQAFVGMPTVEAASKALEATNGYQLIGKPMVVVFARSIKPKQ